MTQETIERRQARPTGRPGPELRRRGTGGLEHVSVLLRRMIEDPATPSNVRASVEDGIEASEQDGPS